MQKPRSTRGRIVSAIGTLAVFGFGASAAGACSSTSGTTASNDAGTTQDGNSPVDANSPPVDANTPKDTGADTNVPMDAGKPCSMLSDCPASTNECVVPTCSGGFCGATLLDQTHTLSTGQTPNDCQKVVCNGAGGTKKIDDPTDLPLPSTTVCKTTPACTGTPLAPSYTNAAPNTSCVADGMLPAHVCGDGTAAGTCVECNQPSDCILGDGGLGNACTNHVCM
jgi:hypothetical protein